MRPSHHDSGAAAGPPADRGRRRPRHGRGAAVARPPPAPQTTPEDPARPHCIICTDPIEFFAFGECNHATCHVCTLRLRALYRSQACPLCKAELASVVIDPAGGRAFETYELPRLPARDAALGVYFATEDARDAAAALLRMQCPLEDCDFAGGVGFAELRQHVKAEHGKMLCDVCTTHKRAFAREFRLFTAAGLRQHKRRGDRDDPSFRGHPECEFCHVFFYGSDELYEHCKKKHETCFLCERRGIRHAYFRDYAALEEHFGSDHVPCGHRDCLAKKFVVFDSELDLKAHELEEHRPPGSGSAGRGGRRPYHAVPMAFSAEPAPAGGSVAAAMAETGFHSRLTADAVDPAALLARRRAERATSSTSGPAAGPSAGLSDADFPAIGSASGERTAQGASAPVKPSWVAGAGALSGQRLALSAFPPLDASARGSRGRGRTLSGKREGASLGAWGSGPLAPNRSPPRRPPGAPSSSSERPATAGGSWASATTSVVGNGNTAKSSASTDPIDALVRGGDAPGPLIQKLLGRREPELARLIAGLGQMSAGEAKPRGILDEFTATVLRSARPGTAEQVRGQVAAVWRQLAERLPPATASRQVRADMLEALNDWRAQDAHPAAAPARFANPFGVSGASSLSAMSTSSLARAASAAPRVLVIKDRASATFAASAAPSGSSARSGRGGDQLWDTIAQRMEATKLERAGASGSDSVSGGESSAGRPPGL